MYIVSHCSTHSHLQFFFFFFFNDTATTEIYTLSLHDALPILVAVPMPKAANVITSAPNDADNRLTRIIVSSYLNPAIVSRSEEHTSELQSHLNLVCRLLLEKKKIKQPTFIIES